MNPLDEIEMEMGKERTMKYRCDHWKHCTSMDCGHQHEHDPYNRCTDNSTCRQGFKAVHCIPVEPERVCPDCGRRLDWPYGAHFCIHLNTFRDWRPIDAVCQRMGMCTYPEPLFICSKAGECRVEDCIGDHNKPHERRASCHMMCYKDSTCIPYVPEDEAREWFIVSGPKPVVLYDSNLTKGKADYIVQHWKGAEYRAFKWSDGLKGGE